MHRLEGRGTKNLTWFDKPQASFKYIFMIFLLILNMATTSQGADVKAVYGIAAGGNITARDIIIKSGLSEKEFQKFIREYLKKEAPMAQELSKVSKQLGITEAALENMFRTLGKQKVPPEKLLQTLAEIAQNYQKLQEQMQSLTSDDKETESLRQKAKLVIDQGRYEEAERLLNAVEKNEIELARKSHTESERHLLKAAASRVAQGDAKLTQLEYLKAADHFKHAYEMVPASYTKERWGYMVKYADALENHGYIGGDNAVLVTAIKVYKDALGLLDRKSVPLDWAQTQNGLGNVLMRLGEREAGTQHLEEAVLAYREALKECTRERVPLNWAGTQGNLGNVLTILGEREAGTQHLEEAVIACREALKEFTQVHVPLDWAGTQNNLGNVLLILGEREAGTQRLEEAVNAYREALKEQTRDRAPLDWAQTQNGLGNALERIGTRKADTKYFKESISAYGEALKEYTQERTPLYWAGTQNNLGNALSSLGEREAGTKRFEEAVIAYRKALKEFTQVRIPLNWAQTHNNLGYTLCNLGKREAGTKRLEEAVTSCREALKERTRERVPLDWAQTQNNLGIALHSLGERTKNVALLEQARTAIQSAYDIYKSAGYNQYNADFDQKLKDIAALITKLR